MQVRKMRLLEEEVVWVVDRVGELLTKLVKDRLLGCIGQVSQWGLWQE